MKRSNNLDRQFLMHRDLKGGHAELVRLFAEHKGNMTALAAATGVAKSTIWRWLRWLQEAGLSDPRKGRRGPPGRPPSLVRAPMESRDSMGGPKKKSTRRKKPVAP